MCQCWDLAQSQRHQDLMTRTVIPRNSDRCVSADCAMTQVQYGDLVNFRSLRYPVEDVRPRRMPASQLAIIEHDIDMETFLQQESRIRLVMCQSTSPEASASRYFLFRTFDATVWAPSQIARWSCHMSKDRLKTVTLHLLSLRLIAVNFSEVEWRSRQSGNCLLPKLASSR